MSDATAAEIRALREVAEAATVCTLLTTFAPFMKLDEGKRLLNALADAGYLKRTEIIEPSRAL